ncbi:hypothetical protein BDW74DRAFT_156644 [Aspergillus multicolor]|uniref:uncharacterized protein n=1 Tax=Aspergillus multicolor TaxID=41759 RepID=UPI003CCDF409
MTNLILAFAFSFAFLFYASLSFLVHSLFFQCLFIFPDGPSIIRSAEPRRQLQSPSCS